METLQTVAQIVLALGIVNVWLVRYGKATSWRGGEATNMEEEFAVYGLPGWFMRAIGFLKLTFAAMLIVGIWVPELVAPAAIGLGVLMIGAVLMHAKVRDPIQRSLPALTMLVLCTGVAIVAMQTGAA